MEITQILREDYQRFPKEQTYSIYAKDVYFKDPLYEFRGRDRYQKNIHFIETWLLNCRMELHDLYQDGNLIRTDWTLHWNTPLPWKPAISISGWSELTLNNQGLIVSHIDYWHCTPLDVIKQHFGFH